LNQKCYEVDQGLKNVDSSLVSSENFREILPFNGWAQVRY